MFINHPEYVGYIAGFFTTVSFIPQVYKSFNVMVSNFSNPAKISSDVSIPFVLIMAIGMSIWILYGITINMQDHEKHSGNSVIVWNSASAFFAVLVIIFTILSRR